MEVEIARLDEKLRGADKALNVARDALDTYKSASNEWRQAMNDQRVGYVTRTEAVAFITIGVALSTMVAHFMK